MPPGPEFNSYQTHANKMPASVEMDLDPAARIIESFDIGQHVSVGLESDPADWRITQIKHDDNGDTVVIVGGPKITDDLVDQRHEIRHFSARNLAMLNFPR